MNDKQKIEPMESGEFEMRKAFEEVVNRNVKGAVEFSNGTRVIVRDLEKKVTHLEKTIIEQDKQFETLKGQIAYLQQQLYR